PLGNWLSAGTTGYNQPATNTTGGKEGEFNATCRTMVVRPIARDVGADHAGRARAHPVPRGSRNARRLPLDGASLGRARRRAFGGFSPAAHRRKHRSPAG